MPWAFYISFIWLKAFTFLNMIIGIVVNVFEEEYQKERDEDPDTHHQEDDYSEFTPIKGEASEYFEDEPMVEYNFPIKIKMNGDISYEEEIFIINDEEFTFLKNEKDYLIFLLMASYNPSLIKSITAISNN